MSLIIKGMDMPESCLKCPFTYEGDCTADEGLTDVYLLELTLTERHPECPLKELPAPHGRLIDAEYIDGSSLIGWQKSIVKAEISQAPTVVEAEE